jgi:predicted RNA-binding Zn-ribbon protein involved in translation (DUF1610 family)
MNPARRSGAGQFRRAGASLGFEEASVEELRNLAPNTRVPISGAYKCEFCGSGGWADTIATSFRVTQRITLDDMEKRAKKGNIMSFKAGDEFPECPNCGKVTLWALVESEEEEDK